MTFVPFDVMFRVVGKDYTFAGTGSESVFATLDESNFTTIANVGSAFVTSHHSGLMVAGVTETITLFGFDAGSNANLISVVGDLFVGFSKNSDVHVGDVTNVSSIKNVGISVYVDNLNESLVMAGSKQTVAWVNDVTDHALLRLWGGHQNTIYGLNMDGATIVVRNGQDNYVNSEHGNVTYGAFLNYAARSGMENLTLTDGDGDSKLTVAGVAGSSIIADMGDGDDTIIFNSEGEGTFTGGEGRDVFVATAGEMTITDFSTKQNDAFLLGIGMTWDGSPNSDGTWTIRTYHDDSAASTSHVLDYSQLM